MTQTWDPGQYNRFAAEREQPFWDLAGLLEPAAAPRVVDLGCGDGRLTAALAARLGAETMLGVDSSPAMLARAAEHAGAVVTFAEGDLASWRGRDVDIVFSNAALHWVPDHARVLAQWRGALRPGGQLAVQVPANDDHPSHRVSRELADTWFGARAPRDPVEDNVLRPEQYAEVLDALGFARQHVRLQVYCHHLASSADVVEWTKGTSLTRFTGLLEPDEFERFVDEYRARVISVLGDDVPYLYTFKRILMWGRLEAPAAP